MEMNRCERMLFEPLVSLRTRLFMVMCFLRMMADGTRLT